MKNQWMICVLSININIYLFILLFEIYFQVLLVINKWMKFYLVQRVIIKNAFLIEKQKIKIDGPANKSYFTIIIQTFALIYQVSDMLGEKIFFCWNRINVYKL